MHLIPFTAQEIEIACQQAAQELQKLFQQDQEKRYEAFYFDRFTIIDERKRLEKTFKLYAAPTDLDINQAPNKKGFNYHQALEFTQRLKRFHGYNGEVSVNETALNYKLLSGSYKGGWFLPTAQMLESLLSVSHKSPFKGTFNKTVIWGKALSPSYYYSCSPNEENPRQVYHVNFKNYETSLTQKNRYQSVRPVRAVLQSTRRIGGV